MPFRVTEVRRLSSGTTVKFIHEVLDNAKDSIVKRGDIGVLETTRKLKARRLGFEYRYFVIFGKDSPIEIPPNTLVQVIQASKADRLAARKTRQAMLTATRKFMRGVGRK